MKKIIFAILSILMATTACNKKSSDTEAVKQKIMEYENQIAKLNNKITELKKQLPDSLKGTETPSVIVETVKFQNFENNIEITGTVKAKKDAIISPQLSGMITQIYVEEGQHVKKGQPLLKLNDEVLRMNLAQLETKLLLADTMYLKQKKLYEQKIISEVQYLQSKNQKESLEKNIASLKTQIKMATLTAPFDGIVDQIFVKQGEIAAPGKPVIHILNLSHLEAEAELSENYLEKIKKGSNVILTFPAFKNLEIKSKISFIGNNIDPVNRTFRIKANFKNVNNKILPNLICIVKLTDFKTNKAIVVNTSILAKDLNGWYVFVVEKINNKTIAKKRYVNIGKSDLTQTIITNGLKENDKIIVKGYNTIKDGMIVNVKN